ncbi:MAG: ATP-binding protein [Syntrophorhabdales bacterium]
MTGDGNNVEGAETSTVIGEIIRPGEASSLAELMEFVAAREREEGFGAERIEEIGTALAEALGLIITRAYRTRSGEIRITCKHDAWGKLVIVIVDTGEPFNILLADVAFAGEEATGSEKEKATARLIKKLIDNIEYKRVEQENTLSFFVSGELRRKR